MKNINSILITLLLITGVVSCTADKNKKPQPMLGFRSVNVIEKTD